MLAVGVEPPAEVVVAHERLPIALGDPLLQPAVLRERHDVRPGRSRHLRGAVGRAVVDHQQVGLGQRPVRLGEHAGKRTLLVPCRDEHDRAGHRRRMLER
jgi:hypothetical protein